MLSIGILARSIVKRSGSGSSSRAIVTATVLPEGPRRRDDDDRAVADLERDADPRVLAVEVLVHALGALLGQVDGVGVERPQHAVDRALDELLVVRDVDVVVLHQVEHLGEQIELAAQVVGGLETAGQAEAEQEREGQGRGRRAER